MRVSPDSLLARTFPLGNPKTALAAIDEFPEVLEQAHLDGLIELAHPPHAAGPAIVAMKRLQSCPRPEVESALLAALQSNASAVRFAAVQALAEQASQRAIEHYRQLVLRDPAWMVRRVAVEALAKVSDERRWYLLHASDDPHWRVRHALLKVLLPWGKEHPSGPREFVDRIQEVSRAPAALGLCQYLLSTWGASRDGIPDPPAPTDPAHSQAWWDWDPAVLAKQLKQRIQHSPQELLPFVQTLISHSEEQVRTLIPDLLHAYGEVKHFVQALSAADEPRLGIQETLDTLLKRCDYDLREEMSTLIFQTWNQTNTAQRVWAIQQIGTVIPYTERPELFDSLLEHWTQCDPQIQRALIRAWGENRLHKEFPTCLDTWQTAEPIVQAEMLNWVGLDEVSEGQLVQCLQSNSSEVRQAVLSRIWNHSQAIQLVSLLSMDEELTIRIELAQGLHQLPDSQELLMKLRQDSHPYVRAAALDSKTAQQLIANPEQETSWHVLARAGRLTRTPLWELEPELSGESQSQSESDRLGNPIAVTLGEIPNPRRFGPDGFLVPPLGLSGHYGLPAEGFTYAVERGANLLFWEPNYQTLTEFSQRLSSQVRNQLHYIVGTFEAEPERIRRDVERALRALQIEQIRLFLLFWTRSWERITPDVIEVFEELKSQAKIGLYSLSTHSRPLALEAIQLGWNPLMVRHSVAHRGAEAEILPRAHERGTTIITFNNTCYGRLLKPSEDWPHPNAADCYRYSLAQPGVTLCLTAPANLEQLEENLQVMEDPRLLPQRREQMEAHGAAVYQEEKTFTRLIRSL